MDKGLVNGIGKLQVLYLIYHEGMGDIVYDGSIFAVENHIRAFQGLVFEKVYKGLIRLIFPYSPIQHRRAGNQNQEQRY